MYTKLHRSYRTVVALCDEALIGKKIEDGERQLDIRENFYKDKQITHAEAVKLLCMQRAEDATFNIVGPESIAAAEEAGLIPHNSAASLKGVPFTLVF